MNLISSLVCLSILGASLVSAGANSDLPDVKVSDFEQYWFTNLIDHYNY